MTTKRDIAIFSDPVFATYLAKKMGTVDVNKSFCPQDETLISGSGRVFLRREIYFLTDSTF